MVSITQAVNIHRDQRLARKVAAGDRKAVEQFVDQFGGRLQALARRYAAPADVDDLTQEIFLDLFRCIDTYGGRAQLSTWAYRVALNHCLRHRERVRPQTASYEEALAVQPAAEGNPFRAAARSELRDQVNSALAGLSEEHRVVVILHEMHGLTYNECADTLGVPVGTVKSRLSNAFRRLRDRLSGYVGAEEPLLIVPEALP
ncbi:MAG: RNA polymerase sigma factor [Capsulimonadaceae bacterium]